MHGAEPLAYVAGPPQVSARLKLAPEDFQVRECLGFEPDGTGSHALLHVRKREANTEWVARQLARHAGLPASRVSFAGLKDRQAVTEQWFSVDLAGAVEPDWATLDVAGVSVLRAERHGRKLKRGALTGNRFHLRLRELSGPIDELEARLARVTEQGVPNYFGPQRFGRDGANLNGAEALFAGARIRDRHKRGMFLSAARSFLFNTVLSARVAQGSWCTILEGEALSLRGSRSFFVAEPGDTALAARLAAGDISPSGPLWGTGEALARAEAAALEHAVLEPYASWRAGLEAAGLRQERRALRLLPDGLQWDWEDGDLVLEFQLPPGTYATALVRELILSEPVSEPV